MSARSYTPRCVLYCLLSLAPAAYAENNNQHPFVNPPPQQLPQLSPQLAPVDLTFGEFYKTPVGHLGLEPTEKLRSLDNKRVRIVGFMAKEEEPMAGIFILTAHPATVAEKADGTADDLPIGTITVYMPARDQNKILAYRPGPWVITGILQLGNREDANGRACYARLIMDQNDAATASNAQLSSPAIQANN